eukprot:gene47858-58921_t
MADEAAADGGAAQAAAAARSHTPLPDGTAGANTPGKRTELLVAGYTHVCTARPLDGSEGMCKELFKLKKVALFAGAVGAPVPSELELAEAGLTVQQLQFCQQS